MQWLCKDPSTTTAAAEPAAKPHHVEPASTVKPTPAVESPSAAKHTAPLSAAAALGPPAVLASCKCI